MVIKYNQIPMFVRKMMAIWSLMWSNEYFLATSTDRGDHSVQHVQAACDNSLLKTVRELIVKKRNRKEKHG